ncbi:MAG: hypothetical protein SX243_05505 [Acidobacteriota bacterium]|nr:hypothetical protein [Acidobacteriota bacterium]
MTTKTSRQTAGRRPVSLIPLSILILALAITPRPAQAFNKHEHLGLSQAALLLALEALEDEIPATAIRARLDDCPKDDEEAQESEENEETPSCISFAALTRAADFVLHAENLVPDAGRCLGERELEEPEPEYCRQPIDPCKPKIRQAFEAAGDPMSPFEGDLDRATLALTRQRLDAKARRWLNRLAAVHRNLSHFEACAADTYNRLHRLALTQASERAGLRDDWWLVPLMTEAVALHFLQDSFPPGHLLTPRAKTPDVLARGMHNRKNGDGAPAFVESFEGMERFLRHLEAPEPPLAEALEPLGLTPDRILDFRTALPLAAQTFYGDGALARSWHRPSPRAKKYREMHRETLTLLLLSARSITEVLSRGLPSPAPASPGDLLNLASATTTHLYYTPWSGGATPDSSPPQLDRDVMFRPGLEVLLLHASSGAENPGEGSVSPHKVPSIAGYKPYAEADNLDRWHGLSPEVSLGLLQGTSGEGTGERLELSLIGGFSGDGDVRHCRGIASETSEPFQDTLSSFHGFTAALNLGWEEWSNYEAARASLLSYPFLNRLGSAHINTYAAVELGLKRYMAAELETEKFFYGVRAGIGLGIIFAELGAERGHYVDAAGEVRQTTTLFLGARVQLIK